MALNSMYCVDVSLHAASGLFMFTLPPKPGTTREQKLIKKGELRVKKNTFRYCVEQKLALVYIIASQYIFHEYLCVLILVDWLINDHPHCGDR